MLALEFQRHQAGEEILSALQVARELGCSKAHVYKVIQGKVEGVSCLPAISMGRRKLVRRSALETWKQVNEQHAANSCSGREATWKS